MFAIYNKRYNNLLYSQMHEALLQECSPHMALRLCLHIQDMAFYLAQVTRHPDCPAPYKAQLTRAIHHRRALLTACHKMNTRIGISRFLAAMAGIDCLKPSFLIEHEGQKVFFDKNCWVSPWKVETRSLYAEYPAGELARYSWTCDIYRRDLIGGVQSDWVWIADLTSASQRLVLDRAADWCAAH